MEQKRFVKILIATIKQSLNQFAVNAMAPIFSKILQRNNQILIQKIKKLIQTSQPKNIKKQNKIDNNIVNRYLANLDSDMNDNYTDVNINYQSNPNGVVFDQEQLSQQIAMHDAIALNKVKRLSLNQNGDPITNQNVIDNFDQLPSFLKNSLNKTLS